MATWDQLRTGKHWTGMFWGRHTGALGDADPGPYESVPPVSRASHYAIDDLDVAQVAEASKATVSVVRCDDGDPLPSPMTEENQGF